MLLLCVKSTDFNGRHYARGDRKEFNETDTALALATTDFIPADQEKPEPVADEPEKPKGKKK